MRTENSLSPASIAARLQPQWARVRRKVLAQSAFVRWGVAALAVALIVAIGYVATLPKPGKYLQGGKQYSADDIAKITRALDAQTIAYRVEEGRIGVAAERLTEAMQVVAKLAIDPRPISEIREEPLNSSFFASSQENERRGLVAQEKILETMIRQLDGIMDAYVSIHRAPTRILGRTSTLSTAFVRVETEGDRLLDSKTVQTILTIIQANNHDIKTDAMTVMDRKGTVYWDPKNPALGTTSRTLARQNELSQEILEEIEWIKGVRVTVQLVPAPPPAPIAAPVAVIEEPPHVEPAVGVNQGMDLDAEAKTAVPPVQPTPPPVKPAVEVLQAHIWVKVPISYYYKLASSRNPSAEDLQPWVTRTETLIKTAVNHVLSPEETAPIIVIDTIPDNIGIRTALEAPTVPETRTTPSWWIPAGVGGGVATMGLILGVRMLATRRPKKAARTDRDRGRYDREDPPESGPAPSERVRELIRRNPEAAASVLNRWIGQGEHEA